MFIKFNWNHKKSYSDDVQGVEKLSLKIKIRDDKKNG